MTHREVKNKMASSLLLICGTLLLLWLIKIVKKKYSYFSDRNMLSPSPTFPLGNFWKVGMSVHFIERINSIYRQFKGKDVLCGFYIFTKPVFLILDIELIKNITVKDFYSFHGRGLYHNEHTGNDTKSAKQNALNRHNIFFLSDPLSAHLFSVKILITWMWRVVIRSVINFYILSLSLHVFHSYF